MLDSGLEFDFFSKAEIKATKRVVLSFGGFVSRACAKESKIPNAKLL